MLHSLAVPPRLKQTNHFNAYFASLAMVQSLTSYFCQKKRHLGPLLPEHKVLPLRFRRAQIIVHKQEVELYIQGQMWRTRDLTGNNMTILILHKVQQPSVLNGLIPFFFISFFIFDSTTINMQIGAVRGCSESILTQGLSVARCYKGD